jgi:hypothetical protein
MKRIRTLAMAGLLVCGGLSYAAPASAATSCPARTLTKPYVNLGDSNEYFVIPGGTFDTGLGSWTKTAGTAAFTTSTMNSGYTGLAYNPGSIQLSQNTSITSPSFCIAANEDAFRFAMALAAGSGTLYVRYDMTYNGVTKSSTYTFTKSSVQQWGSAQRTLLPASVRTGDATVRMTLSTGPGATFWIDQVMFDPWRTR